jgi:hypothetical protein
MYMANVNNMATKIPQTKQEAFAQLDVMLSEKDKNDMVIGDAIEFHFSLGMWIRNNWIYEQNEEDVNRLAKAFRTDYIVFDPDSLSGKIIESYQRYLKRKRV